MGPLCAVCESPTAFTLHFGGRCCKACAAFFRRTVALDLKYECASDKPCEIHFSMRLVCRECRLRKCYSAGMRSELVRSRRENFACTRRKDSRNNSDAAQNSNSPSMRQSSSPEEIDDWSFQVLDEKPPKSEEAPVSSVSSASTATTITHSTVLTQLVPEESSRTSSFDGGYYSSYPSSSNAVDPSPSGIIINPSDQNSILQYYHSMETGLCSRRRIMYTSTDMDFILDSHATLQCPYTTTDLRPHDFRNFRGMLRHDFVILFDYATRFPEFNSFISHEKNMFYRLILAVDFILSSAYYSAKLGQAHRQMILTNGEFLCMDPLPLSGNEPNARQYFASDEDFSKYKALMPMHIAIWEESVIPFSRMNVTFEEFCLLKALTVWHVTYYKFTETGREKCRRQRNIIINCLSKMCHTPGGNGENRLGELLMSMNYIMVSEPEDDCADFRIFSARCPSGSKKNSVSYESSNGTIRYRFTLGEVLSWNIDAEVIVGNGWTRITLREIPRFLVDALDFISARGFNIDGIFRKEGNSARLNRPEIQEVYRGMLPIPSDFTVLDVCTMVKRFLKDLKPTLLNSDDVRMNIIRMAKKARISGDFQLTHMEMIEIFESTPRQLSSSHLGTLGYVMRILNRIVKHSDTHKMTTDNLAVVLVGSVFGDYMAGGGTESRKKMQQAKKCTEAELNARKEDMGVQVAAVKLLLVNANLIGLPHGHYVSSSRLHLNNPLNIRSTSAMPNIRCASVSENELTSSTSSRGTHIFSMSKASMMHQNYPTQNPLKPTLSRRDSDLTHVKLLKQGDSGTKRSSSFLPIPSLRGLRDRVSNQFLKRNKSPSPDKIRRHMFKPLAVPSSFSPFFSSSSANLPPPPPPPPQETPLIIKRTVSVFDSGIEDVKQGDSNRNIQKNESTSSGRKSRTHTKRGNINSELRDGLDSDSQCSFHLSPIPAEKRSSLSSSSSTITNRSLRRFSQSEQNSFIRGDETPPKKKKSEIRPGLTRRNTADCFQNEHHRRSRRPSRRSTFWGEVIAEEKENHSSFAAMEDQWSDDEYVMEKSEMEDTIGIGESVLEIMNNQARSRRLRVAERRQRRLEDNSKNSESMMALNGSIAIFDKLTSPSRDVKYLSNSKSHMESKQDMTVLETTPITTGGLRTPSIMFSSKSKIGQQIEREMKQRLDVVATPMISRRTASEPVGQQSHSKLPGRAPSAIPLRKLDSIGCQQNGHVWVGKTLTVVPSPMLKSRVEKTNEDEKISPILARSPLFRSSSTAPPTEIKLSPFFGFRSKSQFTDERVSSKDFAALATPPRGRRVHSRSERLPQSNLIYSSPPIKPIETQHAKGGNSNDALRSSSPIVNQSSSNLTGNRLKIEAHARLDQKLGSANDAQVFKFPFLPPMKSHESKERKSNISSARISPTPRSSSHSSEDQSGDFGESNLFGDYNELLKHSTEDTQFPHQPVAARPSVTALRNSACGLVQSRINHFQLIEQINISQYRAPFDMPSGRPSACSLTSSKSIDAISSSGKL